MSAIKSILIPFLLIAGMGITTACNEQEDEIMSTGTDKFLKIEAAIADTRAIVTGTSFQHGDDISVIVPGNDNLSIQTVFQDERWNMSEAVALTDNYTDIYAIYPYNTDIKAVSVKADGMLVLTYQQDINITYDPANGQKDYMYGFCEGINVSNTTAHLYFHHALARVTLALTKGEEDAGKGIVSKVVLQNRSADNNAAVIHTQGTLIINTNKQGHGTISAKKDAKAKIEMPVNCTMSTSSTQTIDLLVIPTTVNEDAEFILTIDGSPYVFTIPQSTWEAGKQYTYPITVNRKTVITPTVIPGEKVYMGFNGDNGQPLYWSSYNLGSQSPEEYGGLYGWADPTGEKTSIDLNDYPSANPPADISGSEHDIARQMWGDGWRIPSNSEMWSLLSNSTEEWTTLNGVQGVKYTSEKNGNTIFIPVAPMRQGNTVQQSSSTFYWLSELNKDDHTMAGTFYIYKGNNLLDYPTAGQQRYIGLPIRPVYDGYFTK